MSGGSLNVSATVVAKMYDDLELQVLPAGARHSTLANVIKKLIDSHVTLRVQPGWVFNQSGLGVALHRLDEEEEQEEVNFGSVLKEVEGALKGTPQGRLRLMCTLTNCAQLAHNTVHIKMNNLFEVNEELATKENTLKYYQHLGFVDDEGIALCAYKHLRQVGVDLSLLCLWAILAAMALDDPGLGVTPGLTVSPEQPTAEAMPNSAPPVPPARSARAVRTPSQPAPPPARGGTAPATADPVAALQQQLAAIAVALAQLQPQRQSQHPAPVSGIKSGKPAPELRGGYESPPDLDHSDSDSDYSEGELSAMAEGERERNQRDLATGQQALKGTAAGESPFFAASVMCAPGATNFWEGPLLRECMIRGKADYRSGIERTRDEFMSKLYDGGLVLISVNGVPGIIALSTSTKVLGFVGKISTKLHNPDSHPALSCASATDVSAHLFPATVDQFEALIKDQLIKAMSAQLLFPRNTPQQLIRVLLLYQTLSYKLLDGIFGGHTTAAVQAHRHHVTVWAVVMQFHLNRWMRATLQGDISLLISDFDTTWQSTYKVMLGLDSDGRPLVPLQEALLFLAYRCPRCSRLGACEIFCPSDACRTAARATVDDRADAQQQPGYMKAYKAFQQTPGNAKASHEAFSKTQVFKDNGFSLGGGGSSGKGKAARSTLGTCQERANEQQLIRLHACPNFQF